MPIFVEPKDSARAKESGPIFVEPSKFKAPPMNIESPFWSMPPYGDGTAASLAATRPGQPDEKVGYGELSNIAGRTGAEMTAAIVGTIPEFAAELATGVANNPNQPGSLPQQNFRPELQAERDRAVQQRASEGTRPLTPEEIQYEQWKAAALKRDPYALLPMEPSRPDAPPVPIRNQAQEIIDAPPTTPYFVDPLQRGTLQNPLAGAGAFARQQFGLNDPQNQPNPALSPDNTPYMDFSGDTPMRNKVLRLASEGAGMVPIGTEIAAGTAIGGPIVGGAAAALAMGAEKFQRGLDEGKSRDEALQEGTISALGNTALFSVPLAAHAAKYLPPRLASRMVTVALSGLEMGGKMMGTGGIDAASNIDVIPTSTEEWKKAYEDVRDGTWNARSNFLAGALLGGFQGAMTPLGRAKAQAEAKAALDEFVDLGDATVRPRTEPSEQIGRSGNGVDVQRNAFGRDGGVRFQQGQRALPGPALPGPEPQGAITGPNGRPAIANPRATAPLADAPLFDPNRQVMPEAEVAALIDSLNQQLQARGQRIAVEPIGGAQGPLGLPPGAARGPMPEPPPAIPLPPPMGVGRPIEEAPSRRAVPETAAAPEAPAIPQPTPEQLALEQQILNADLVDSRDIPKPAPEAPKTAKQKLAALRDARKQSLIDTTVAVESAEEVRVRAQKLLEIGKEINATGTPEEKRAIQSEVIATTRELRQLEEAPTQPTSPLQSDVEPQTQVGATESAPEFSDMVKEAQRWRGAAMNVARGLEGNPREALKHSSRTTKGDLDKYLMNKFGVGPTEARDVSNELTRLNLPDDLTAQPEDFAGEPWAKTAPETPKAEFLDWQERPRGQAPIALYNIPTPEGGKTTVTAETARERGFEVPEPPAPKATPETIRAAALDIAGAPETRVRLADLREKLGGTREEQDAALLDMQKSGEAVLMRNDDPQDITPRDEAAKLMLGDNRRDLVYVKPEKAATQPEPVYSPETQAIVDAYGGRTKALEVLMRQRAAQRGNEKASPQTLAAIEELTGGKKTGQADLFGLGDMKPAPKADLPGQTRLTTETNVIGRNVPAQYAEIPGNDALTDIRKQILKLGVKPGGRFTAEDLGYTGKNKPPWVRESGRYTTDQWLEQAHEAGLISADELSDPSAIQRLMRGKQNTKIPVAPAGVEIPGINQKAPDTGKPSSIGDIMQGMGLTEQKTAIKPTKAPTSPVETTSAPESTNGAPTKHEQYIAEEAAKVLPGFEKQISKETSPTAKLRIAESFMEGETPGVKNAIAKRLWEMDVEAARNGLDLKMGRDKPFIETKPEGETSASERKKAADAAIDSKALYEASVKNTLSQMTPAERMADVMARFKEGEINQQQATAMRKAILKEKADAEKQAKKDAPKKGKKRGPDMTDPEAGAINLSAMGDLVVAAAKGRPIIRNTKGLPEKVFDESIRARGLVNKYERRAQQIIADFEQGYRKSVGGVKGMMSKVPDNLLQLGTDYLTERSPAGKQAILSQFPIEMHAPLRQMRTLVDELTQKWIDWGVVSPGRTQILKNNMGSYLSRQHKTFYEPNFRNIIPEMVKQRMRNLLRKWDPSVPNTKAGDDIIEGRLNEWIDVSEDENSGLMWRGSPLGARNFDIMKQRNDFPDEVLDLWGVERDVRKNLLNTVMKQAKPLANTIFQNKVLDHGRENNYIFTKADIEDIQSGKAPTAKAKAYGELQKNRQGTWMTEAAEQGKSASPYASMGVLADVYVPKPLKNAMQDMMKTQEHGLLMKTLLQYNGIAAMSKTVGSVTTQSLNFIANQGFFFGSGYAFYKPLTLANRINQALAMTGTELKSTWGRSARELAGRGLELGVMNDADVSQEIAKLIEGGKGGVFSVPATKLAEWGDRYRANRTEKHRRAVGAAAQVPKWIQDVAGTLRDEAVSMYQAGDDFWKALMWLSDTEYQMDLHPSWSRAKAEEAAAVAIREYGLPFYSESPRFIQNLRYVPIPAPFKTYAVEAPRVLINQATQAKSEIFSGNATATAMGFRRSLGQAFAYGMPIAGSIASALAWKLSDQDEDTIRDMGPEWNRDSNFVHYNVDRSKGIVKYWNVSRTSVQSEIGDPINAFIRGDEATDKAARLALASLDPFLQEQLGWKALRQVIENEDDYGRPIYNDADTDLEFAKKVGSVLGKSILPGTVESVRRILKDDAPIQKSLAEATGQRITTVNMPKELEYATRSYMTSVRAPSMDVKKAESGGNQADIAEQKRQRLDYHKQQWESLHDKVSGMKAFGVDTIRIMDALKKGGMSQKNINNLMYGVYVPPESMQ